MKVVLLQDVAKIGRRYEIVDVPNGHAMNMLIPKGLAQPATPENLKKVEALKSNSAATEASKVELFNTALSLIEGKSIVVSAQVNAQGHLFEALKPDSIIGAIGGFGAVVTEDQLKIAAPIKEVGEHVVTLQEGGESKEITIVVEGAESDEEAAK